MLSSSRDGLMRRQRREAVLAIQAELDAQQALNRRPRRLTERAPE